MTNWLPSTMIGLKTPMEMWSGKLADYSSLHVFRCPVYVMYNSQERTKLDPKSKKCIFLGYANRVKGYRLWDPIAHKVLVCRDMIFLENELQGEQKNDDTIKEITTIQMDKTSGEDNSSKAELEHKEQGLDETNDREVWRSTRQTRLPSWHSDYVIASHDPYCLLT